MNARDSSEVKTNRVELLLIEDDPDYRSLVEHWLASSRHLRFGVRWAARLDDAWTRIDRSDVILLDLGLPDAAGLDTLRAARDLAGDAPIVVLTGSEDADIGPRAVRAGADAFVSKRRAEPEILHAVLRRALAARANARAQMRVRRSEHGNGDSKGEGVA
jgi:two-component system sensor histidine kinase UhpB